MSVCGGDGGGVGSGRGRGRWKRVIKFGMEEATFMCPFLSFLFFINFLKRHVFFFFKNGSILQPYSITRLNKQEGVL